jgi:hypothetical protein
VGQLTVGSNPTVSANCAAFEPGFESRRILFAILAPTFLRRLPVAGALRRRVAGG